MKNTVLTFKDFKEKKEKISMITAYDYTFAKLVEKSNINAILVGDSLGMTMMGEEDTVSVTLDDMIHHSKSVTRACSDTFVICDMPFMSYGTAEDGLYNAGKIMKEGRANAVKLEGGVEVKEIIKKITDAKIPVCAHIGLTPQAINALGGFKVQAKSMESAKKLIEDAKAVEEAGAFAVVLECVPSLLAEKITNILSIPTIGIGAGSGCDGQVLVLQDMLGMNKGFKAKFVKHFASLEEEMVEAFNTYDKEVKEVLFPGEEHGFKIDENVMKNLD